MKKPYYLSLCCLCLLGCVSQKWVEGYVQHELAGVKDIVAEEVYPLEKAIVDLKTQVATLSVVLKNVTEELQTVKDKLQSESASLQAIKQQVVRSEEDSKRLEERLHNTVTELKKVVTESNEASKRLGESLKSLASELEKTRLSVVQIQTGPEATGKESAPGKPGTR